MQQLAGDGAWPLSRAAIAMPAPCAATVVMAAFNGRRAVVSGPAPLRVVVDAPGALGIGATLVPVAARFTPDEGSRAGPLRERSSPTSHPFRRPGVLSRDRDWLQDYTAIPDLLATQPCTLIFARQSGFDPRCRPAHRSGPAAAHEE